MINAAEARSAWTLLHPEFSVAVPEPEVISVAAVFGLPSGEPELARYIDAWISLDNSSRTVDHLYNHWFLGRGANEKEKRWSVVHNVSMWAATRKNNSASLRH